MYQLTLQLIEYIIVDSAISEGAPHLGVVFGY